MVQSAVLGFPRIGGKREVKKATEAYWADKINVEELQKVAKETRLARWQTIKDAGVDVIPSFVLIRSEQRDLELISHVSPFAAVTSPSTTTSLTSPTPST